jgi:hypothetical protein
MSGPKEPFLSRWLRRKAEAREAEAKAREAEAVEPAAQPRPPGADAAASAPSAGAVATQGNPAEPARPGAALPPLENLTPESDFRPFMTADVDPQTRREALKKLFADARFNVPDPFEAYSEDYTKADPIPLEMLKRLSQAQRLLFDEKGNAAQAAGEKGQAPGPEARAPEPEDGAGKKDA